MEKILVSACLIGDNTTYEGKNNLCPLLEELNQYFDLVPFCPEVEGGLSTPRAPAEILRGSVKNKDGLDVTGAFNSGASKALALCSYLGIRKAILKEASPSCGVHEIHDGSFSNKKKPGQGITAALLSSYGIQVLSENDLPDYLTTLKEHAEEREAAAKEALDKAENSVNETSEEKKPFYKEKNPTNRKKPFFKKKEGEHSSTFGHSHSRFSASKSKSYSKGGYSKKGGSQKGERRHYGHSPKIGGR